MTDINPKARDYLDYVEEPRSAQLKEDDKRTNILYSGRDPLVHEGIPDSNLPFPSKPALAQDLDALAKACTCVRGNGFG